MQRKDIEVYRDATEGSRCRDATDGYGSIGVQRKDMEVKGCNGRIW